MASFNDCLTKEGQRLFAMMASGRHITFTKVVLGDGIKKDNLSESDISEVIHPVATLNIDSVTKTADNKVTIRALFHNTQTSPFYLREKGVYATIDGKEEFLVFYANNGALAEYIEVAKTQLIEKIIRTVITFSDADNINITINSNAYTPPTIIVNNTIKYFISGGGNTDLEPGSEIIVTGEDGKKEVYTYVGGDPTDISNYILLSNTKAIVVMHENIPISNRVESSLYFQLGNTQINH